MYSMINSGESKNYTSLAKK